MGHQGTSRDHGSAIFEAYRDCGLADFINGCSLREQDHPRVSSSLLDPTDPVATFAATVTCSNSLDSVLLCKVFSVALGVAHGMI